MAEGFLGLHATLRWMPYAHNADDGERLRGYRREDGAGFVIPDGERWWVSWAHPILGDRPGWHHHAFGTYANATAGAIAFDEVYELERLAGNTVRCPDAKVQADAS